jgi:hypothetical protein
MAVGGEHQVMAEEFLQNPLLETCRPTFSFLVANDSEYHALEISLNPERPRMGLPSGAQHSRSHFNHRCHAAEN